LHIDIYSFPTRRSSDLDKLGGFDELFNPFYEEDVDLGYRARKRGFINIFEPKSKVEHYKEKGVISLNFSQTLIAKTAQRNQLQLDRKSTRLNSSHDQIS